MHRFQNFLLNTLIDIWFKFAKFWVKLHTKLLVYQHPKLLLSLRLFIYIITDTKIFFLEQPLHYFHFHQAIKTFENLNIYTLGAFWACLNIPNQRANFKIFLSLMDASKKMKKDRLSCGIAPKQILLPNMLQTF